MKKRIISFLLVLIVGFSAITYFDFTYYSAKAEDKSEEKIYSNATIDDEFATNRVLIVLNEEESAKGLNYSRKHFEKAKCKEVKDLTSSKTKKIKEKQSKKSEYVEKYNRVLELELDTKSKVEILDAIDELSKMSGVVYAGPDYIIHGAAYNPTVDEEEMIPDTSDTFSNDQWALNKIQIPRCWEFSTGIPEVLVGVVDSGIDGTHEDLVDVIHSDLHRNFLGEVLIEESIPTDTLGHGTSVAGIIGAKGDNNKGVAGVCWNTKLVSLKVIDSDNSGYLSNVIDAINFAESNNIPILNMSLSMSMGENAFDIDLPALRESIESYSGLVICAAGNFNKDIDQTPYFPACIDCDNVISVGASDRNDNRWVSTIELASGDLVASNYGQNCVDVFAPGISVYTTVPDNDYDNFEATSAAAPHVTGVVALMKSLNPNLTNSQIKNAIISQATLCVNVTVNDESSSTGYVGKRLNAYRAIKSIIASNSDSVVFTNGVFSKNNAYITKLLVSNSTSYRIFAESEKALNVKIFDSDFSELEIETVNINNGKKIRVDNIFTAGTYYISIKQDSPVLNTNVFFRIYNCNESNHVHSYESCCLPYNEGSHISSICDCGEYEEESHMFNDLYGSNNKSSHKAYCACGMYHIEPHVVTKQNTLICLICGGVAGAGSMIIQSVTYYTENGSYIRSDGVVVLDAKDIESYFNGTLIFIPYNTQVM